MAFNNRNRNLTEKERKVEEFVNGAEPPGDAPLSARLSPEERAERRARGRRFPLYTVRGTEGQDALIKYASEKLGISQNQVYLRYVLNALEEEFGSELPVD
jgi:hypothetical protein